MTNTKYLLGLDIGSSSIKAAIVEADSGVTIAKAQSPDSELPINTPQPGWAEQDPESWWKHAKLAINRIFSDNIDKKDVAAIGISYQMHGLVLLDDENKVLRPSIIWCDSRAAETGDKAFSAIGPERCMSNLLNSPGNFTASKLGWVKNNEEDIYKKVNKFLLPGDYIAFRLSGELGTTISGLSEGIFWDFKNHQVSAEMMGYFGFQESVVPDLVPTFGFQAEVSGAASEETGLPKGIPISYRAGDQPNNALSLNVFNPGELAATAGTSGVIYGILDKVNHDDQSRVNLFAHVNHTEEKTRLGVLLCVNGTGILYSWLKNQMLESKIDYPMMNQLAGSAPVGSDGLKVFPFGNGVERILQNKPFGGSFFNIDFNRHSRSHLIRAAQEGIVFALNYGFEAMRELGVQTQTVRAGDANMFQSELFGEIFSTVTGTEIELYDTDGAIGAARAAGIGSGFYSGPEDAFSSLKSIRSIQPNQKNMAEYADLYSEWKNDLKLILNKK